MAGTAARPKYTEKARLLAFDVWRETFRQTEAIPTLSEADKITIAEATEAAFLQTLAKLHPAALNAK